MARNAAKEGNQIDKMIRTIIDMVAISAVLACAFFKIKGDP